MRSDFFKEMHEKELREKTESSKLILKLARKAITYFNKTRFSTITINLDIAFTNENPDFSITVFCKKGTNKTFTFYSFIKKETNEKYYDIVLKAIKTDDFNKIRNTIDHREL